MAEKFSLDPDEVMILKAENVWHGGAFAGWTDDLILTNKRITIVRKGMFGNVKEIIKHPLSEIKVYNDQAQAINTKDGRGMPQLEIYFTSGEEKFQFQNPRIINDWVMKINEVVTGKAITPDNSAKMAIPGSEFLAKTLKSTIDTYKDAFGIKKKVEQVSCRCQACGASVSGEKGTTGKCPYCDSFVSFE